jgi:hypothetical protein
MFLQRALEIAIGVLVNVGPMGIAVILLIMSERGWRFSLSMLFALMTCVAITIVAWTHLLLGQ